MTDRLRLLLLCALIAAPADGSGQTEGPSRSVRIIDEAPSAAPATPQPAPAPPPNFPPAKPRAGKSERGVRLEVLPEKDFLAGQPMSFRVTVEKAGYLVLVDVDAQGRLAQIFPNMVTLADPAGTDEKANYVKAGQSLELPGDQASSLYRFVASPPVGIGMVVAILSDAPIQVIDLPDVPSELAGQARAADYVRDAMRSLQILPAGAETASARRQPKWAFATVFYGIK
jgi:hypothetical protein